MNKHFPKLFTCIAIFTFIFVTWINFDFLFKTRISFHSFLTLNNNLNSSSSSTSPQNSSDPLAHYFNVHTKILNEKNVSLRKIFFSSPGDGGYGNRLYTIISSTLIAILLKCQLVVNWRSKETLYIEPPVDLFDRVGINYGFNVNSNQSYHFPHPSYPFEPVKNIKHLIEKPYNLPDKYMNYLYKSGRPLFTEISANVRYYDTFKYYKLAREETLSKALNALKDYKKFTNEELQSLVLNVAFEIGGNILNRYEFFYLLDSCDLF